MARGVGDGRIRGPGISMSYRDPCAGNHCATGVDNDAADLAGAKRKLSNILGYYLGHREPHLPGLLKFFRDGWR